MTTLTTTPQPQAGTAVADQPATDWDRFVRWAGWCGLVASAAYLVTILATNLLGSVEPADGRDDVVRFLRDLADQPAPSVVYGIAGIVLSLLYLPLSVAGYHVFERRATSVLAGIALAAGLLALVPAYALTLLEATTLAPAAETVGPAGADALHVARELAVGVVVTAFSVGSILTLGVVPLLWGLDGRRTGALAPWLSWFGIVGGVTGVVWAFWYLPVPLLLVVVVANVVATFVFFTGASIVFARRHRPAATGPIGG